MPDKKVLLFVHGMGTHEEGEIVSEFKRAILDRAKAFKVEGDDFLNDVDYEEFNYSGYLDGVRKQFAENSQARSEGFQFLAGKGFDNKLVSQLTTFESKFDQDEFFYTHWLDVILYSTMYFGEKIRIDFCKKFTDVANKYDFPNVHVIGHSLGTAVVHDALAKMYRLDFDPFDDIPDLKPGNQNIGSVWTFANVSRMVNILNGLADPYSSSVKTGNDGCTSNFFNIRHKYDPFTWFKTYEPHMEHLRTYTNETIKNINTHDFYEYVTAPRVARAALRFLYGRTEIKKKHLPPVVEDYKQGDLADQVEAKAIAAIVDKAESNPEVIKLKAAIKVFKEVMGKIEKQTSV